MRYIVIMGRAADAESMEPVPVDAAGPDEAVAAAIAERPGCYLAVWGVVERAVYDRVAGCWHDGHRYAPMPYEGD